MQHKIRIKLSERIKQLPSQERPVERQPKARVRDSDQVRNNKLADATRRLKKS